VSSAIEPEHILLGVPGLVITREGREIPTLIVRQAESES
jgi:hypothetical protein